MSILRGKQLPLAVVILMITFSLLDFFHFDPIIRSLSTNSQTWAIILAGFALGIGVINMVQLHATNIMKRRKGKWIPSAVMLVTLIIMTVFGIISMEHPIFLWSFDYIYTPLNAAVWSLTAFYLLLAIYKAFRISNLESGVLVAASVIVLLNNGPIFQTLGGSFIIPIHDWTLKVLNIGGTAAFYIAGGVGMVLLILRLILGMEGGFMGGET